MKAFSRGCLRFINRQTSHSIFGGCCQLHLHRPGTAVEVKAKFGFRKSAGVSTYFPFIRTQVCAVGYESDKTSSLSGIYLALVGRVKTIAYSTNYAKRSISYRDRSAGVIVGACLVRRIVTEPVIIVVFTTAYGYEDKCDD